MRDERCERETTNISTNYEHIVNGMDASCARVVAVIMPIKYIIVIFDRRCDRGKCNELPLADRTHTHTLRLLYEIAWTLSFVSVSRFKLSGARERVYVPAMYVHIFKCRFFLVRPFLSVRQLAVFMHTWHFHYMVVGCVSLFLSLFPFSLCPLVDALLHRQCARWWWWWSVEMMIDFNVCMC